MPELAPSRYRPHPLRLAVFALLALAAAGSFAWVVTHKQQVLGELIAAESDLRTLAAAYPVLLPLGLFLLHTVTAALSIPIGILLSVVAGWLFGVAKGLVIVSFASTTGATLAMLISRYLLRDAISHRFAPLLDQADRALERDGPFYLLSLRLVHVIPFWLVNLIMGWTTIRLRTFWWASQLGMLPASALYVYTGAHLSLRHIADDGVLSIITPGILVAFFGMAILPLIAKFLVDRRRMKRDSN